MKYIVIYFAFSLLVSAFTNAQIWEEKTKTLPLAHLQELANIPGTSKFLMFGGKVDLKALDDTYIYDVDLATWHEVKCTVKPYPRYFHSMAPLTEGKVLVFGGNQKIPTGASYSYDTDLFVFDITTNNWSKLQSKSTPGNLIEYEVIQIDDGKVLFFDHSDVSGIYPTHETFMYLYNYFTNSWSIINVGNSPQHDQVANIVKFDNNKLLMITQPETTYPEQKPYATWTFDITTNTWDSLETFNAPIKVSQVFYDSHASSLGNKKFFVYVEPRNYDAKEYYLFDGNTNKWSDISNKHIDTNAEIYSMHTYGDGKSLIFYTDYYNKVDIFDLADTSFTTVLQDFIPPEPLGKNMYPISEDKMLCSIYNSFRTGKSNNLWIYNKRTDKWTLAEDSNLPEPPYYTVSYLGNNQTLIWVDPKNSSELSVYRYDAFTDECTYLQTANLNSSFYGLNKWIHHSKNGDFLMICTENTSSSIGSTDDSVRYVYYNLEENKFIYPQKNTSLPYLCRFGTSNLSDTTVVLFGGYNSHHINQKDTYILHLPSLVWRKIETKGSPSKRLNPLMKPISDGRVLLHGASEDNFYTDDWIFDIKDSSWTHLEQHPKPFYHSHYQLSRFPDGTMMLMSAYGGYWLSNENLVSVEDSKYPLLHNLSPELALSPNPAHSSTAMNYIIKKPSQYSVEVCTLEGKVLMRKNLGLLGGGLYSSELDFAHIQSGSYFVRLTEPSGLSSLQKLVIVK